MTYQKLNFADFETEQLSKSQQKKVCGGDSPINSGAEESTKTVSKAAPTDPSIGQGKGMG